jgi:acyl-CoA-dependent ceramide synthase
MSKYLEIPWAPDVLFVIFLASWFVTRQVLLLKIILGITLDMPKKLDLIWDPSRERYVTYKSYLFFTISLWLLYAMLCAWFWMGCKVAYNVVRGQGAEDTRSDGEERFVQSPCFQNLVTHILAK